MLKVEVVNIGKMLTKKEAAELLQVSEMTLDRARKRGLKAYKIGIKVRFDEDELKEFFREKK